MTRVLRPILLSLSLVGCAAIAALWYRSHRVADIYVWETPAGRHYEVATLPGQVRVTVVEGWINPRRLRHFRDVAPPAYPIFGQGRVRPKWYWLGMYAESGSRLVTTVALGPSSAYAIRVTYRLFSVPYAVPLGVLALWPAWEVAVARRKRLRRAYRVANGLCVHCGYDLRESRGRCPECGENSSLSDTSR